MSPDNHIGTVGGAHRLAAAVGHRDPLRRRGRRPGGRRDLRVRLPRGGEGTDRRLLDGTDPGGLTPAEIDAAVRARIAAGEDLYTLDEGALRAIDPDLVVTQDLCAVCAVDVNEVGAALEHLGCRADVLTLDPMTLEEVLDSIGSGRSAPPGARPGAHGWWTSSGPAWRRWPRRWPEGHVPKVAVLEWTDPPFSLGPLGARHGGGGRGSLGARDRAGAPLGPR